MEKTQSKEEFVKDIQNYISHSKMIFEKSKNPHYSCRDRIESLRIADRLRFTLYDSKYLPLSNICEMLLMVKKDLVNILPAEGNKSRESSVEKLNSLIRDAQNFLQARRKAA